MLNQKISDQQLQKTLEALKNGSNEEKIDLLNNLSSGNIDDNFIQIICGFVEHSDKGIRNAATNYILRNRNSRFPYFIVPFIKSNDISVRNLAGEILINLGSLSIDAIIQADTENNDDNLKFIIDILGLIGDQKASLFIIGILSSSENDNVVLACIEALGNLKVQAYVDVLILYYDRNELYKPTIVEALGKISSKAALNFLVSRFQNEDEITKYSILESLGSLGDIDTFFFLLEQINFVNGPLVLALISSIFMLREKFNLDIPFDNRMKSLLLYTIQQGTVEHKKIAFSMINSFDDKDILGASLTLLGENFELDDMIKNKLFNNIEFIYHEIFRTVNPRLPNLRQILNLFIEVINYVHEYDVRLNISMLDIRYIANSISGFLNHHDEEVRRYAMEILFNIDQESAILFADSMSNDESAWNRLRLLEMLEKVPDQSPEPIIEKLIKDEDDMVRERAAIIKNLRVNNFSSTLN
ncbi:MAG: HEAT repeat domain-containing protein [Ignavibacteriales bacterium]|nr:HEAT repeat domain-containing protein [Ignavibacteriales bacterium]